MPQLRQNIITGEWVVIAPERAKRPSDFTVSHSKKETAEKKDVFEVGGKVYKEQRLTGKFESKHIYVIPNSYPAFVEQKDKCSHRTYELEDFYRARPSTGGHDVVVVKKADTNIYEFSTEVWHDLFSMAKKRYQYWVRDFAEFSSRRPQDFTNRQNLMPWNPCLHPVWMRRRRRFLLVEL